MVTEAQFPFLAEKGHVVSLVGGGGKTTLLYALSEHCARRGWRVLAGTTTHIRQPKQDFAAAHEGDNMSSFSEEWQILEAGHQTAPSFSATAIAIFSGVMGSS